MTEAETFFNTICSEFPEAVAGQLFGKPCYKKAGKAFVCFFRDEMVFKLKGGAHSEALALDGAVLFDPSLKHRPMKEWVQVPYAYHAQWPQLARSAFDSLEV